MKDRSKTLYKHNTAMIVIIAALILAIAGGAVTFAEYTKSTRAKRVVATYLTGGVLFSSNYLVVNSNPSANVYKRFIYTNSADTSAAGAITICNYAQGNPGRFYETNIIYRLTASIVKVSESNGVLTKATATAAQVGTKTATVTLKDGTLFTLDSSNITHDFGTSTLSCLTASTDICSISFSTDFTDNSDGLCLYLCATPEPPAGRTYANIHTIDAVFSPTVSIQEARNNWKGEFNDDMTKAPDQYDGFNYVISGTGAGTCTLKWHSGKLDISQLFLLNTTGTSGTETIGGATWNTYSFSVNSDTVNRYDLQFYYHEGASFSSWAELAGSDGPPATTGYVILEYTEE